MKKQTIILAILFLIMVILATITLADYYKKDANNVSTIAVSTSINTASPILAAEPTDLIPKSVEPVLDNIKPATTTTNIIFLHHSTGGVVWNGGVAAWFANYNTTHNKNYNIKAVDFPTASYSKGWSNYPYNYWDIWINPAKNPADAKEQTLEELTKNYDVIIWKHCYPVSSILADTGSPNIDSDIKTEENYKLQYSALKTKMHEFPNTRFIVWTGAALVQGATNSAAATRAQNFADWVKAVWDEPDDNIYIWDFRDLETDGGLYLLPANAASVSDSHPNSNFASKIAPLFSQRIVDVIEGRGDGQK